MDPFLQVVSLNFRIQLRPLRPISHEKKPQPLIVWKQSLRRRQNNLGRLLRIEPADKQNGLTFGIPN
jgi:hypothetical protein